VTHSVDIYDVYMMTENVTDLSANSLMLLAGM